MMDNNKLSEINKEEVALRCPNCDRGLVSRRSDDKYKCDKCKDKWGNSFEVKKDQIATVLDKILKEEKQAIIEIQYNPIEMGIWATKEDGTKGLLYLVIYEDDQDVLDELYDYANALADKFSLHAEYIDLAKSNNEESATIEAEEETIEIKDMNDFLREACIIPFPSSVTQDAEPYGDEKWNKYMGFAVHDFAYVQEIISRCPNLYVYTMVEGDNDSMYIVSGARWVNRIAYFIGTKNIKGLDLELD